MHVLATLHRYMTRTLMRKSIERLGTRDDLDCLHGASQRPHESTQHVCRPPRRGVRVLNGELAQRKRLTGPDGESTSQAHHAKVELYQN